MWKLWVVFFACTLSLDPARALAQGMERLPMVGVRVGSMIGNTTLTQNPGYLGRAFFRNSAFKHFYNEVDLGLGMISGDLYKTQLIPLDYRLVFVPQLNRSHAAYFYVGGGATNYKILTRPPKASRDAPNSGWTGHIPLGVGLLAMLGESAALDFNAGYNFSFTDDLDAVRKGRSDGFWTLEVGISFGGQINQDPDRDGLKTDEEETRGTDFLKADTDGDGLSDGDEVLKYHTDPLKADTDGDGLTDGDEVLTYHTDPLKADTDGDGLTDGDEVLKYHTDPLKVDTDGDGLSDGDEILHYRTDPLKADTDGDGVSDRDEILKYRTDPLVADTDKGGVPDGVELSRGTNPLNTADDSPMPEREELKIEINRPVVLEGVVFRSGNAEITPQSEPILRKVFNTLDQHPDIEVEIHGHTDNVGSPSLNLRLSRARAEAVKAYLVQRGIASGRIVCKAFASVRPRASNATPEGRQLNRRIEFVRVK